ncbi:MAG: hypothetical protein IT360_13265 [Gemmatimonadaceae bacterium]|nr:hypothetical protein [Gemmatimonadaceae bacterium]
MLDASTIATARAPRQLSPDVELDVALLRDPGDRLAPASDLLRSPAFFRLRAPAHVRAWYAVVMDGSSGESLAGGWFAEVAPGEVQSGARGLFGALHTPFAPLHTAVAARMIRSTEEELIARGVHRVHLTLPHAAYAPEGHAVWMNAYLRLGYTPAAPDLVPHADVGTGELAEQMGAVPRAIVQTAARRGMSARALRSSERADAHTIVSASHARHGRAPIESLEGILAMETALPGTVHWHGTFQRDRLIAASISYQLSETHLSIRGLGDAGDVDRHSPMALLVAHVYGWSATAGVRALDLGLASHAGEPNEDAMSFGHQLGFTPSLQYTLRKELVATVPA